LRCFARQRAVQSGARRSGTATGVGAAVSILAAGFATQVFGYTIGFLLLALIGGAGLAIIYVLPPETMPQKFH
jgi:cyanate permease